jgi:hypothetical protein
VKYRREKTSRETRIGADDKRASRGRWAKKKRGDDKVWLCGWLEDIHSVRQRCASFVSSISSNIE